MSYPEHEKLDAVKDRSQAIGEFLDWLRYEKGLMLGSYVHPDDETMWPAAYNIQELLAEFFGIDLQTLEAEKQRMLEACRRTVEAKD